MIEPCGKFWHKKFQVTTFQTEVKNPFLCLTKQHDNVKKGERKNRTVFRVRFRQILQVMFRGRFRILQK